MEHQVGDKFYREYVEGTFELASTYMDPDGRVAVVNQQGFLQVVPFEGLNPIDRIQLVLDDQGDPVHTVVVTDAEGKPWVFTFNSDPGEDIAISPAGDRIQTYTHDGSGPTGVPEVLWFTMLGLIGADAD